MLQNEPYLHLEFPPALIVVQVYRELFFLETPVERVQDALVFDVGFVVAPAAALDSMLIDLPEI